MDVRHLQAYLAVAEHLHFGRAADQLYMAQAPLSRTISGLENELGDRLFDRNTRSVALTPLGRALLEPAREAVAALRRVAETAESVRRGETGVARVEFSGVAAHRVLAALARHMRDRHPQVRLELTSQVISRPALANIVEGRTDIALGRFDQLPPGIAGEVVMPDSLVLALPATHRLAGEPALRFARVAREPFVSLPYATGSITTDRLWRLGFSAGAAVDNVQFAPDTASCIALVGAGVGCHLALASAAERHEGPDVTFVPLAPADVAPLPDVHLRVIWRRTGLTPAVQVALDEIRRQVDTGPGETTHL
ncbi:LysR family transcriptional regulator [Modestobacter sp. Leaf380]|uniref:LysR family transcriptional regulator n=1 Tax=Modestobacter sp. Leaf380 TaxID=1736356 RepID=UPI0007019681|nr:LysR substrate-binding domain-containing protein [Modestobacter sp. Leaf380]KQS65906.1 hypothetical protein ASG41_13955 [Modestobacter sp. Leaf380]